MALLTNMKMIRRAVERELEIIGEALNRILKIDSSIKMRKFLLQLAIILSCVPLEGATKLEIHIMNCSSKLYIYNQLVKIFDNEGGSIEFLITKENEGIKKIEPGDYVIEYYSRFGRREVEMVSIRKGERKKVHLCSDKFTAEVEPIKEIVIIDSLKNGENYVIFYDTRGCFHQVQDSLDIYKAENAYFLKCQETWIKLSGQEIALIRRFENRLWNIKLSNGGCTTIDTYGIRYKGNYVLVSVDDSCKWNGFLDLKHELQGKNISLQQCADEP